MSPLLEVLVVAALIVWLVVAPLVAVLIGKSIKYADRRAPRVTNIVTNQRPASRAPDLLAG